jgi:hypothetical protein
MENYWTPDFDSPETENYLLRFVQEQVAGAHLDDMVQMLMQLIQNKGVRFPFQAPAL